MKSRRILSAVLLLALPAGLAPRAEAQANQVIVVEDERGWKLQVDGQDFMVFGMNWGYIPVGENYRYSLWDQSDEFIVEALDAEMSMLREMGVNAIRLFSEIPPRWVEHIYDNYGIMTAVNHLMGRYGFEVNGRFVPETDYGDETTRRAILADLKRTVEAYRDTRGVLMYLLGNENNYGLSWTSFEIEDLPEEADDPRAEYLYTLMGEGAALVSGLDDRHPVALANGDINYLDVIARTCPEVDIMGANVYRGASSGDLFQRVRDEMGVPFVYTEFGADAYDAKRDREDDVAQAGYLLGQWREIYEQSYGQGGAGTALGGFIFQWSDGWWKFRQEENLDVHDTNASWATGAYVHDFVEGRNNMNEEWWGIAAKGPSDDRGFIPVTPRTSYYVLQQAFRLDPYAGTTTAEVIRQSFGEIRLSDYSHRYATGRALDQVQQLRAVRLGDVRMRYESSISNGDQAHRAWGGRAVRPHRVVLDRLRGRQRRPAGPPLPARRRRRGPEPPRQHLLREPRPRAGRAGAGTGALARAPESGRPLRRPRRRVHHRPAAVHHRRLLPHRPLPLGLRGRLLRPLPGGQLRPQPRHLQRPGAQRLRDHRQGPLAGLEGRRRAGAVVGGQRRGAGQVPPPGRRLELVGDPP